MKPKCDADSKEAGFDVSPELYSEESLALAARVFERQADAYVETKGKALRVTLEAKKRLPKEGLDRLAREFLNEALNQEMRRLVGAANKNLAALLVTQALYSARGEEKAPPPLTPEQEKEASRLMAEAQAEVERTMPARLPPQGLPIPPETDA